MTKKELRTIEYLLDKKYLSRVRIDDKIDELYDRLAIAEDNQDGEKVAKLQKRIAKNEKDYDDLLKEINGVLDVVVSLGYHVASIKRYNPIDESYYYSYEII